jgi:hypothetical protein
MLYEFEEMELEYVGKWVIYQGASEAQVIYGGGTDPRDILIEGQEYLVDDCDVHSWKTRLYLDAFPGKQFNSVFFELV